MVCPGCRTEEEVNCFCLVPIASWTVVEYSGYYYVLLYVGSSVTLY